jgi:hypothetical protein
MMALLQFATDPFSNQIDGDLRPCLLASKTSQANNSTLQRDVATSTMEAEYSALSTAMRDLLLLRELLISFPSSITVNGKHPTTFRTTVHEDNSGASSLANLEPGRNTSFQTLCRQAPLVPKQAHFRWITSHQRGPDFNRLATGRYLHQRTH